MFICQVCGGVVPPRTPAARVVVHRRAKRYPRREKANRLPPGETDEKKRPADPGGTGWEIAKEAAACPDCAARCVPQRE